MRDVMIDLETFGTSYDAVIVQIGACYFDRVTGEIGDKLLINVDAEDEVSMGFKLDALTVYWWLGQNKESQNSILDGERKKIVTALIEVNSFLAKSNAIWCHAPFDFVILSHHFRQCGIKPLFHYRNARDLRTLVDISGYQKDKNVFSLVGPSHNALNDCLYQVQYTVACLNELKRNRYEPR